ncbi:hypothetical protein phiAS5_ORF0187 [Aeromonas phage phiAS5]|uniref:Uncharacterized protein n=1 Tax=Aeromonas phage phiAS5 TaxID=879630 RepID=E1A2T4_9CAUD|nr:hypothetical protein phiAS5_ORF0187 [Aeromonas phage phiAS5]ADM80030.1 hypothetical protein phiAS5_ORF0187 [Aeromonas phage phiAS5]
MFNSKKEMTLWEGMAKQRRANMIKDHALEAAVIVAGVITFVVCVLF